jgi:nicotinate-nucleotide adenylyltransferase
MTSPLSAREDVPLPEGMTDAALRALDVYVPPLRGLGRVGLLGGSFNPPHLGHVMATLAVYATEQLDHVWVLPTASHAFGKELASFGCRVRMAHLAFRHFSGGVAVVDLENRLPRPSYTVNLLRALHRLRPGIKPVWIAGSDILADLPRWHEPDEILRLARVVVLPRAGESSLSPSSAPSAQVEDSLRPARTGLSWSTLAVDLPRVSSTDIRARLQQGSPVAGLLDREVLAYIEEHELYRAPSTSNAPTNERDND